MIIVLENPDLHHNQLLSLNANEPIGVCGADWLRCLYDLPFYFTQDHYALAQNEVNSRPHATRKGIQKTA